MESTEELKQSQNDDWDSLKLTRADDICIGKDLELWKISLKSMLNKVKSSKLEQIKGTAKLKEADQHIVDAFLIVLGYKTKEDRKQVLKDFRASKIDLLKQTKFVKYEDITYDDCKQIQNLLADFISNKIKNVADPYKDMAKWVTNLVEMKIASCCLPRKPVFIDIEGIRKRKLDGLNLDGLNLDDLDLDSLNVELLKCNETEDWSVIGYIEEHKGKPYDLEQLYDLEAKLISIYSRKDNIDYSAKRPPEEVIYFYNFLLELFGKNADSSWDDTISYTTHAKTIDECLVKDSAFNL